MTALLREQTESLRAELRDTKSQLESKIEQQAVRDLPYVRQMSTFISLEPKIYLNIGVDGAVLQTAQLLIHSLKGSPGEKNIIFVVKAHKICRLVAFLLFFLTIPLLRTGCQVL